MKILRYVVWLCILSAIFFIAYKECKEKGFRRVKNSFKIAFIMAAIGTGLISINVVKFPEDTSSISHERLYSEEYNSLEANNSDTVILAKASGSSSSGSHGRAQPSGFSGQSSGSRPPSKATGTPKYGGFARPKFGQPPGGGPGKPANFIPDEDVASQEVPKKKEEKKLDNVEQSQPPKKKERSKSTEQCESVDENQNREGETKEIVHRIKENSALVREAEIAGRDLDAQRSLNNMVEQLGLGNRKPGIGTRHVFKDVYELRGRGGARVYYREVGGRIEILAKSVKSNQNKVIKILKKIY